VSKIRSTIMLLILSLMYVTPVTATDLSGDILNIGNIHPKYFPVFYSEPGQEWIVDVYKYEASDVEKFTESIQSSLRKIKLKPFPALKDELPEIYISPVKMKMNMNMQQEDYPGILRAWYDGPFNSVVISTYLITNYEQSVLDYTIAHELGHWVWDNVATKEELKQYKKIAGDLTSEDRAIMEMYNLDERRVLQEWFADDFAQYACMMVTDPTKDGYSPLGGSHAHEGELQKYFSKYRLLAQEGCN